VDISFTFCFLYVCFLFLFCVCAVTDFSAQDKASDVKFCTAVRRRQRQGITHFGELCSPRSPKLEESVASSASVGSASVDICQFTDVRSC